MRETIRVYAIDANGLWFKVAGYDRETALKVINDETVKNICHAVELVAVDKDCNIIARTGDKAPEPPRTLRVCLHCLQAIESREGRQVTREIYIDEDENPRCDWCEETADEGGFDRLYEIL